MLKKKLLIVILGPTASGKSDLAVKIALRLSSGQTKKKFGINGAEIISADSRQVYKKMDIGTGKITPDTKNSSNFNTGQAKKKYTFTHKGIPHYCIDVASPKRRFTVIQFRKLAIKTINKIFQKKKMPIICGGTGFYIQAVIEGILIPEVPPDWKLRKRLEKKSAEELFKILKKIDPKRAKTIKKDYNPPTASSHSLREWAPNPRRLIRAIEIVLKTGKPVPPLKKNPLPYPVLMIGIRKSPKELQKLIKKRFLKWLKMGLIKEVKNLRKSGLSWKRIEEFGIHYRVLSQYIQKKINYEEMIKNSLKELQNYAKRQITWFKRHPAPAPPFCKRAGRYGASKRIYWVKNFKDAEKLVKNFLK